MYRPLKKTPPTKHQASMADAGNPASRMASLLKAPAVSGKPKNEANLLLGYDANDAWKDLSFDARDRQDDGESAALTRLRLQRQLPTVVGNDNAITFSNVTRKMFFRLRRTR